MAPSPNCEVSIITNNLCTQNYNTVDIYIIGFIFYLQMTPVCLLNKILKCILCLCSFK